jgi:tau tubulin kinase
MMTSKNKKQENILKNGTIIKNKWKITGQLGKGAFGIYLNFYNIGETYAAYDLSTKEEIAIKIEKLDSKKMVLRLEVICLKKLQECPYVVRYIHSGRQDNYNYLVMERLGDNLADLRKKMPKGVFSLGKYKKIIFRNHLKIRQN